MKNNVLKNWLLCATLALFTGNLSAQYATALTVTDIEPSVARKMEANASALLTELNEAFFNSKTPQLTRIRGLSKNGQSSILSMWEMTPFRCIETEIIERCYNTPTGYQVRNIPLFLAGMPEDESYREIAINFDKSGAIEDIYFTIFTNMGYIGFMSEAKGVTDERRRILVLNFLEKFRTAYNRKDINLLDQMYSDDALIITGTLTGTLEVKQVPNTSIEKVLGNNGFSNKQIKYQSKTKKEYLHALSDVFKNNAKINVIFDNIEMANHTKYDDIYGVTLKQDFNSTNYSDVGWLFLMIDFKDGENMQIHVRTWQPEKYRDGRPLSEDEIFGLHNFDDIRGM